MKKEDIIGILIGVVSYILFIVILFSNGLVAIINVLFAPVCSLIPELCHISFGLKGLIPFLAAGLFLFFLYPLFLGFLIKKFLKINVSFSKIIIGFLMTAIILNIVKFLFGLP